MASLSAQVSKAIELQPVSKALQALSRIASRTDAEEYSGWLRLELAGYLSGNPALTNDTIVPEYRTVVGQHYDVYGRRLVLEPDLSFVNELRLRNGVEELESWAGTQKTVTLHDPNSCSLIKDHLEVEVQYFRFEPVCLVGIIAAIRVEAEDRAHRLRSALGSSPATFPHEDIIQVKPNFYGVGLDLNALWRRWRS